MKTFVDCTYYSFESSDPDHILTVCNSTMGYLDRCSTTFKTYFVARSENDDARFQHNKTDIIIQKGKQLSKWMIPLRFNSLIRSLKPDYILVHGFGYAHYLILLKLSSPKSKILLQCNGYAAAPVGLKKYVFRLANKFIDGYLFSGSENAKSWIDSKIIGQSKVFEVMEGATNFSNKNRLKPAYSFLWVGRLTAGKDPMTMLSAFRKFHTYNPSARLTMVYDRGELTQAVEDFVSDDEVLSKAVTLAGFVRHGELEAVYNAHQYFISASHFEGSGYALAEAMACGCIPIVTAIPSFKFMTDSGRCAFLFEPGNAEDLLKAMTAASNCDIAGFSDKVVKRFREKLSYEAIASDIIKIYDSL